MRRTYVTIAVSTSGCGVCVFLRGILMRTLFIASVGLLLAACNQTTQQPSLETASLTSTPSQQEDMQSLPPIYDPLVDMHKKSKEKFAKDHAECRKQAEPQERAARAAMAQQQTGAALQVAGSLVSMIPSNNFRHASNVATTSAVMQDVGAGTQAAGAAKGAGATADYALVVDTCLSHRGYKLLR